MTKKIIKYFNFFLILSLFLSLFLSSSFAQQVKIPSRGTEYVSDFAGLLKPSDKMTITNFASELEKKTSAQIAVVTVKSTLNQKPFKVFLLDFLINGK